MESDVRKRGYRLALLGAVVLACFAAVYLLRDIFAPLILGFLIAYVLDPIADALERVRVGPVRFNRFGAVVLIFSVLALVAALVLFTGGFYLTRGVNNLYHDFKGERIYDHEVEGLEMTRLEGSPDDAPKYFHDWDGDGVRTAGRIDQLSAKVKGLAEEYELGVAVSEFIEEQTKPGGMADPDSLRKSGLAAVEALTSGFRTSGEGKPTSDAPPPGGFGVFDLLSYLIFCPLYAFFFLLEIDPMIARIRGYLPGRHRPRIVRIASQIDQIVSSFLRGRLIIAVIKSAIAAIGLALAGVDYAIPLGIAAGFLSLIPYIGVYISLVPALILCWLEYSSWGRVGVVLGVFMVNEWLEGFVLVPQILGKEIGLHPLTVIVTLLIFGKVFGFVGLLLSVPLAAITKIFAKEFVLPLVEEFAAEPPEPEPTDGA